MSSTYEEIDSISPAASLRVVFLGTLATILGALAAVVVLPMWLPGLTTSLFGESPKVFWFLSRGTALAGFILLWISMGLGILITNRLARTLAWGTGRFRSAPVYKLAWAWFWPFSCLDLAGGSISSPQLIAGFCAVC